jgi:hypothetical protein
VAYSVELSFPVFVEIATDVPASGAVTKWPTPGPLLRTLRPCANALRALIIDCADTLIIALGSILCVIRLAYAAGIATIRIRAFRVGWVTASSARRARTVAARPGLTRSRASVVIAIFTESSVHLIVGLTRSGGVATVWIGALVVGRAPAGSARWFERIRGTHATRLAHLCDIAFAGILTAYGGRGLVVRLTSSASVARIRIVANGV